MTTDAHRDETQPGEPSSAASFYARVVGRVQGVGFRFFVVRSAKALGLAGRVRNAADGAVEVWARGPRSGLQTLEQKLHQGPPMSRVDDVALQWGVEVQPEGEFILES